MQSFDEAKSESYKVSSVVKNIPRETEVGRTKNAYRKQKTAYGMNGGGKTTR